MSEIKIKYADPPEIIVFSISPHSTRYVLVHKETAVGQSYQLFNADKGPIKADNIDEWIRLHTANNHSLGTLSDLSEAFKAGQRRAYSINDLIQCADLAFNITKELLYQNGYASKYADLYDIESTPASELRDKMKRELRNRDNLSVTRLERFRSACLHNDMNDTVEILDKVLDNLGQGSVSEHPNSYDYDIEIKDIIYHRLRKRFKKHDEFSHYRNS